jgi:hypothetical protein
MRMGKNIPATVQRATGQAEILINLSRPQGCASSPLIHSIFRATVHQTGEEHAGADGQRERPQRMQRCFRGNAAVENVAPVSTMTCSLNGFRRMLMAVLPMKQSGGALIGWMVLRAICVPLRLSNSDAAEDVIRLQDRCERSPKSRK